MYAAVTAVSAGYQHSLVLKQDGSVWATGYNFCGQLGDGSTVNRKVFVQVIASRVQVVAAGAFYSMAIVQDGSIWATGSNVDGQFGDGLTTSETRFRRIAPFGHGSRHDHVRVYLSALLTFF